MSTLNTVPSDIMSSIKTSYKYLRMTENTQTRAQRQY